MVNNTCLCLQGGKFKDGAKRLDVKVNKQYKSMEDFILKQKHIQPERVPGAYSLLWRPSGSDRYFQP